jgi:stage II sporulation protein D
MAFDRVSRRTREHTRSLGVVMLAALLLMSLGTFVAATPPTIAAEMPGSSTTTANGRIDLDSTVKFFGRGYGHGVGMSQHGARGRALAGQDAATILAHYYEGTTLGSIDLASQIRVRILWKWKATATSPLVIYGRGTTWSIDGIDEVFPADAALRLIPTKPPGSPTSWRLQVQAEDGSILLDRAKPAELVVRRETSKGRLQLASKPTSYDRYRGVLRVITAKVKRKVKVVNEVALETYLRGVVPAEMPSTWPSEALLAQSIAARSYAARRLRPGESYFDVVDTYASQVYLGAKAERDETDVAIEATGGIVLKSGNSIANTLFHSTGGGGTEHNENVFTSSTGALVAGPVSYLRGSLDRTPDGSAYDAEAPYATWKTRRYTIAQLSAWMAADPRTMVGTLTALNLGDRGVSGRLISVTLIGSAGKKTVSGEVFRSVFNAGRPNADPMMRSTLFDLAPIP